MLRFRDWYAAGIKSDSEVVVVVDGHGYPGGRVTTGARVYHRKAGDRIELCLRPRKFSLVIERSVTDVGASDCDIGLRTSRADFGGGGCSSGRWSVVGRRNARLPNDYLLQCYASEPAAYALTSGRCTDVPMENTR